MALIYWMLPTRVIRKYHRLSMVSKGSKFFSKKSNRAWHQCRKSWRETHNTMRIALLRKTYKDSLVIRRKITIKLRWNSIDQREVRAQSRVISRPRITLPRHPTTVLIAWQFLQTRNQDFFHLRTWLNNSLCKQNKWATYAGTQPEILWLWKYLNSQRTSIIREQLRISNSAHTATILISTVIRLEALLSSIMKRSKK